MTRCNKCPYSYYDYEENYTSCRLEERKTFPESIWNYYKGECRIPLFILKILHKREMKAEAKYWGDLSEETVCKSQGW